MPRTTVDLIKSIIFEDDFDIVIYDTFIATANMLVNKVVAVNPNYTDSDLQLIETWLAAHLCCINSPRKTQSTISSVQASYEYRVDFGLKLTRYGQQAIMLAVFGELANLNVLNDQKKVRKPGVLFVGGNCDNDSPYYVYPPY